MPLVFVHLLFFSFFSFFKSVSFFLAAAFGFDDASLRARGEARGDDGGDEEGDEDCSVGDAVVVVVADFDGGDDCDGRCSISCFF